MMKTTKRILALGVVFAMLMSTSALAAVDSITFEGDELVSVSVNRLEDGEEEAAAKWGDTLADAIGYADANIGDYSAATLTMGSDETLGSTLALNPGYALTIDGDGHTISADAEGSFRENVVETSGSVTLTDVTVDANSKARGVEVLSGTLTLNGETTITEGYAKGSADVERCGGGAFIDRGATLVMNDNSAITGNEATMKMKSDGGGVSNKGTLIMNDDAQISNNTANRYGGGVDNWGGTIEMNGNASISGNSVTNPGGVDGVDGSSSGGVLNGGGTVTMNDNATISSNSSAFQSGGVQNRGMFTMNDSASISNNTSVNSCGGIYNYNGNGTYGTLVMNGDSTIANNSSQNQIGGVGNGATMVMNGNASISGNTAANGIGGAIVFADSTLEMNGGSQISGNEAVTHTGGLYNYGAVSMNDNAQISGNTATTSSGGVLNVAGATLEMNDNASVNSNTAGTNAGGVYNQGTLTMSDNSAISDNTAARQGGGIYNNGGTVTMNEDAAVSGNTAGTGIAGAVNIGVFTMNDNAAISDNTTTAHTGGIYNRGTFTMNGGKITGNTASNGAAITVTGAAENNLAQTNLVGGLIEGNTTTGDGNSDINASKNATVTITGGLYDASFSAGATSVTVTRSGGTYTAIWDAAERGEVIWENATNLADSCTAKDALVVGKWDYSVVPEGRYPVRFVDENGNLLSGSYLVDGDVPVAPADPVKAADEQYTYTFTGWDQVISPVTGEATYTAVFLAVKIPAPAPAIIAVAAVPAAADPEAPYRYEPDDMRIFLDDEDTADDGMTIDDEDTPLAALPGDWVAAWEAVEAVTVSDEITELLNAALAEIGVEEDEVITREQFAYILYQMAKAEGFDLSALADLSVYGDYDSVSEYALAAVEWAVANGLIRGTDSGLILPGSCLTYEQMAIILSRFAEMMG